MVNKRGQIYERNVRHAYLFLRRHFGSRSTVIPSPRGQDLSFSRWRRCYKSRGSFPVYLAAVVQKRSNAPVLGQKLATKVSKSRAIPPYVPGVIPPGWPLISALKLAYHVDEILYSAGFSFLDLKLKKKTIPALTKYT